MVTTVFIFLPLLFSVLHPLKCFKRYTGKWPALHICLDSFQGYFKDGTDGTHDCRCFSSLYLFTRIALFATYSFMKNTYFYPFASILLLFLAALVTVVQPFKQQFGVYNSIHVLLLLNLAAWFVTVQCIHISSVKAAYVEKFSSTLSVTIAILPLFYISFVVLKWVYSRKLVQRYYVKCCGTCQGKDSKDGSQESSSTDSLPYHICHPEGEQPLHVKTANVSYSEYGTI